jgi:hypothetical protein
VYGEYQIYYELTSGYTDPDDGSYYEGGYKINVERETKNAEDGYYYIIPVTMMKKQTLPNKFEAYKRMFNMFMYSEKKVKMKWYQSLFFRFLFMIVAVIFAGPMVLATMMVGQILSSIDPRLAAIIGVVLAIVSFNPAAAWQSTMKVVDSFIKAFSSFSQHAFQASLEGIQSTMETLSEETKDMQEALADMWHQGIYMPLHTQDMISQSMYNCGDDFVEMSYNAPDLMIAQLDNMTNPTARLV